MDPAVYGWNTAALSVVECKGYVLCIAHRQPSLALAECAVIGLGESTFSRKSDKTARAHAVDACLGAVSDAGLKVAEIDGLLLNRRQPNIRLPWIEPLKALDMRSF